MSEHLKLGQIIEEGRKPLRDAIHVAVIPVMCDSYSEPLRPGQPVRIHRFGDEGPVAWPSNDEKPDGIVDPYLAAPVQKGQRFWLFLFPGTVTSIRHEWTHPSFPVGTAEVVSGQREESEKWLREYAERYRANYDRMIEGAVSGEGYTFGDDDGPPNYSGCEAEFWRHIEVVTGKRFDEKHRENTWFSCSC